MKWFWIKKEGELIQQGLNVYPLRDKCSAGVLLLIGKHLFRCRFSKVTGDLHLTYRKVEEEL